MDSFSWFMHAVSLHRSRRLAVADHYQGGGWEREARDVTKGLCRECAVQWLRAFLAKGLMETDPDVCLGCSKDSSNRRVGRGGG